MSLEAMDAALDAAYGRGRPARKMQRVMIVQVPSEANAERLICTRIGDANVEGWTVTQMMDHNGFLVLLLEADPTEIQSGSTQP